MSNYIVLTPAGWQFRRRVPARMRARVGQAELRATIPARDRREARAASLQLAAAMEKVLSMAMTDPELTPAAIRSLARQAFQEILAEWERFYSRGKGRAIFDDAEDHEAEQRRIAKRIEGSQGLLRMRDWTAAKDDLLNFLRERGWVSANQNAPEFRELCLAFIRADLEASRILAARLNGDFTAVSSDPLFAADGKRTKAQAERPVPILSELLEAYLKQARAVNPTTLSSRGDTVKLAAAIMGNRPIADYARSDIRSFFDKLASMPAKYGQAKQFRGKSIQECLAIGEREAHIAKFSPRTIEKHYVNLKGIFDFAVEQELLDKNLVAGAVKLQKGDPRRERDEWTVADLNQLFALPIWSGSWSSDDRKRAGDVIIRDYLFWLPVLAIYTGARLNELSSLYVADVTEVEGVTCFKINDDKPEKRLKTRNALRAIPVHPKLVAIGFLDHIEQMRRKGEPRLWPELRPMGPDKLYSFYATRRFSEHFALLRLNGKTFHGFRHTFMTQMPNCGVDPLRVKELTGHAVDKGEFARYYKGARIARLKEAIDKLEYPGLEIAHLLPET